MSKAREADVRGAENNGGLGQLGAVGLHPYNQGSWVGLKEKLNNDVQGVRKALQKVGRKSISE